jgi:predicted Zn finger-like uncharacterized protein
MRVDRTTAGGAAIMKFECDQCHAQYMIADDKLGKKGVKVKCKKCQHVIIVRPGSTPDADAKAKAAPAPPPAPRAEAPAASPAPPDFDPTLGDVAGADAAQGDGFAQGGPTDPVARAMMDQQSDGPSLPEPDGTGPAAPAPISMFGDQTQLTESQRVQTEQAAQNNERTVVAPAPDLGASSPSEDAAPASGRADATVLSRAPEMTAEPPPPAPAAPPEPAESGNELDDQIAGMFNQMFDESQAKIEEEQRGPTRVLDASGLDALRKQAQQKTEMGGMALDSGPDPRQLEAGLVMKGADQAPRGADDGPADAVWHAAIDDQDVGPLALGELGRHIESGRVDRDTLVWKIGQDDWLPAGDVPEVRALFDKVPPPRIGRSEEPARAAPKASSFDMGSPIDDAPPPPPGASPFDEPSDDASWRPHGLTDVYQAANLAEAAVGMGGMMTSGPVSAPLKMSAPSASSEPEWRPGAASALSALVQDEMKRLDQPPPPGDDGAVLPADDASINAPIFGSLGAKADLDNGGDISDPGMRAGRTSSSSSFGAASLSAPPLDSPSYAQQSYAQQSYAQPSFAQPSFAQSQPPQSASPTKNPLVLAGILGGIVVTLLLVVLVVATLTKGDDKPANPQIVLVDGQKRYLLPDGTTVPVPGEEKPADKPADPPKVADAPKPADGPATTPPAGDAAPDPTKLAANTETPPADAPAADAPPADARPDKPVRTAPSERRDPPKPKVQPDKPVAAPTTTGGKKCDPVLDFDCKTGGASAAPKPQGDAKESLSKTDVLGVIKAGVPAIENCGKKNKVSGTLKMSWKVQTNGKTSDVQVADSKFAGTPVGTCATGVIKGWRFPVHEKASPPITFPFKLP